MNGRIREMNDSTVNRSRFTVEASLVFRIRFIYKQKILQNSISSLHGHGVLGIQRHIFRLKKISFLKLQKVSYI